MEAWIIYSSFIEAWNFTVPSWKYANEQSPLDGYKLQKWREDFEDWFKDGAKKLWILLSLPTQMFYDATKTNVWQYDSSVNDYVLFYQPYESAKVEEYRLPAEDYAYNKEVYDSLTNENVLPSTENSLTDSTNADLTAGVASSLLKNMVDSAQVLNEKKFRADVSWELNKLTGGVLSMYNKGIIDKYQQVLEGAGAEVLTPVEEILTKNLTNELNASKWGWRGLVPYFTPYTTTSGDVTLEMTDGRCLREFYTSSLTTSAPKDMTVVGLVLLPMIANDAQPFNIKTVLHFYVFFSLPGIKIDDICEFEHHNTTISVYGQDVAVFYLTFKPKNLSDTPLWYSIYQNDESMYNDFYLSSSLVMTEAGTYRSEGFCPATSSYSINNTSESVTAMVMYDKNTTTDVRDRYIADINDTAQATDTTVADVKGEDDKKKKKKTIVGDLDNLGDDTWNPSGLIDRDKITDETGTDVIDRTGTDEKIAEDVESAVEDIAEVVDSVTDTTPDDTTTTPPISSVPGIVIPEGDASVKGLFTVWNPTASQLASVASYLWSSIFKGDVIDQFKKWFSNPFDAIISLAYYPIIPSSSRTGQITLGAFGTGVYGVRVVDNVFQEMDCGTISLPRYFNNFLDYSPYTKVSIYLPFVGVVPLNVDDVMSGKIHVKYRIELMTGSCLASIYVSNYHGSLIKETLLYQYSGNVAMQIPLSGANYSSVYSGIIGGLAMGISAYASGGTSALGALAKGSGVAITQSKEHLQRSGSLGGNAGLLGQMKPYLIIERPIVSSVNAYDHLLGKSSNSNVNIGALSGYTELENFDLSGIDCTDTERDELKEILQNGFFA